VTLPAPLDHAPVRVIETRTAESKIAEKP